MSQYPIYSYSSHPSSRPARQPEPPKRHARRLAFGALFVTGLVLFMSLHIDHVHAKELAVQTAAQQARQQQMVRAMATTIQSVLAANPQVQFGVSVIDQAGQEHDFGTTTTFMAGSTAKVLTALTYLHLVEQHKASLAQSLNGSTARSLLQAMIVQSDDTAWATLNDYVGHDQLAAYAEQVGITDYDAADNYLSAHDLSLLMSKLSSKKLLNSGNTALLLGWLKQANYRDYIVPAVPAGDTVYHKVGLVDDTVNDSAIITHGTQSVVLSIFTNGNGTYDWQDRAAAMQQITRAVVGAYLSSSSG